VNHRHTLWHQRNAKADVMSLASNQFLLLLCAAVTNKHCTLVRFLMFTVLFVTSSENRMPLAFLILSALRFH
jgi:hypothetical protein